MIAGKSVVAIIPARGGSKGVPRKNIRLLAGKPLIAWTIEAALRSKYIDRVIVSTDDEEIMHEAKRWGCEVPFQRPKELAQDTSSSVEVILHALSTLQQKYNFFVLLQPTSPFRTEEDIDGCIERCVNSDVSTCVSVKVVKENPHWMYIVGQNNTLMPLLSSSEEYSRRQDLPEVYLLNGAIYVAKTAYFMEHEMLLSDKTLAYVMPEDRSIDIDNPIDFEFAECIANGKRK